MNGANATAKNTSVRVARSALSISLTLALTLVLPFGMTSPLGAFAEESEGAEGAATEPVATEETNTAETPVIVEGAVPAENQPAVVETPEEASTEDEVTAEEPVESDGETTPAAEDGESEVADDVVETPAVERDVAAILEAARAAGMAGLDELTRYLNGEQLSVEELARIDVAVLATIDADLAAQIAALQTPEDITEPEPDQPSTDDKTTDEDKPAVEEPVVEEQEPVVEAAPAETAAEAEAEVIVPNWSYNGDTSYTPRAYGVSLTTEKFIAVIGEASRKYAAENDLYASVMIAQAILESGSGNSGLSQPPYFNLFGVKGAYDGEGVTMLTSEDDGTGSYYTINAQFRSYPSYRASLLDYVDLLTSSYYAGARKSVAGSPAAVCNYLEGRYATSTSYSENLQDLILTYDLTRFDEPLDYELSEEYWVGVSDKELCDVLAIDEGSLPATITADWLAGTLSNYPVAQAVLSGEVNVPASVADLNVADVESGEAAIASDATEADMLSAALSALAAENHYGPMRVTIDGARNVTAVEESRDLVDLAVEATTHLGTPYLLGAAGPDAFDCSGLVWRSYQDALGTTLPRESASQVQVGQDVDFADLHAGDLLFFVNSGGTVVHVAMYLGEGCYIESADNGVQVTALENGSPVIAKRILETQPVDVDVEAADPEA